MYATICGLIPADPDYPPRTRELDLLGRVRDGTLYDALPNEFHEERSAGGDYIPLRNRRPSVRYPLARIVVEDSLALLFGEGHFPTIETDDAPLRVTLANLVRETALNRVMMEAAWRGSVGSAAVLMQILRGRVYFRVLDTLFLSPTWDPDAPDRLLAVTERYKVSRDVLLAQGYVLDEDAADWWFMRRWDGSDEVWFAPQPVGTTQPPTEDASRTVHHGLGFVPVVWIKNLPGGPGGPSAIDGACTFRAAVETSIEIDYQLSQAGRGLKYSSDPTLLIREPAGIGNEVIRGGANALVVSEKGDARLLEINGSASSAVIDYVRSLRELALEGVHGNRASPERLSAAQSGRALEMMNQGLIWLADNLRVSYGQALLDLAGMVIQASGRYGLRIGGAPCGPLDPGARLSLKWPRWYPSDSDDRQRDAQALSTLLAGQVLSRETAVKAIADAYDIPDVSAELARIEAEHRQA